MTKIFKAEILGQEFTLRGDLEGDLIDQVAQLVNQKIQEVHSTLPTNNKTHLSIMAALNIAYDYLTVKAELDQLARLMDQKSRHWITKLEGWSGNSSSTEDDLI